MKHDKARKIAGLFGAVLLGGAGALAAHRATASEGGPRGSAPVVVELFSSEGCSSCPPADAFLRKLDREQPIPGVTVLALEFHVDYWNYLGWSDPFSTSQYSERQEEYARVLRDHGVFTPELIVQGRRVFVGSDEASSSKAISAARNEAHASVSVAQDHGEVSVRVQGAPESGSDALEVWLAATETELATDVASGENRGRRLVHGPIVRSLVRLGSVTGGSFSGRASAHLGSDWRPANVRFVAFVQESGSRRIVGAGASTGPDPKKAL